MDLNWIGIGYLLDTNGYLFWMYVWISFGYCLDLFRIYSQAEARPGASPGTCSAGGGWAGQGGASGLASQPVTVQVHQAIVTGLDTMPQCQTDSSMTPVPGGPALGI
jgi:hypothetical protein